MAGQFVKGFDPRRSDNRRHGMTNSNLHRIWVSMRQRCENPNDPAYGNYGGRGIKVCKRWSKFEDFLADVSPRPEGTSLDRIDVNGHYEPGNCRWATKKQQSRNRRDNRVLTIRGKSQTIAEWAEETGKMPGTISIRLSRGWSEEDAVFRELANRGQAR